MLFPPSGGSATMRAVLRGDHGFDVEFESWLERDEARVLDLDPEVVGFATQPFWLFWPDTDRIRSHAPGWALDWLTALSFDCRSAERIKPRDAAGVRGDRTGLW